MNKSKEAGQKVFYHFVEVLANYFDIYLVSFIRKDQYDWGIEQTRSICKETHLYELNKTDKIKNVIKRPNFPLHYNSKWSLKVEEKIVSLMEKHQFKFVHFEWEQMVQYINCFSEEQKNEMKIHITCHDVIYQMYERKSRKGLLRWVYFIQQVLVEKVEKQHLSKVDLIYTLNNKDKSLLCDLGISTDIQVLTPFFNKPVSTQLTIKQQKRYDLVFFGALNREENNDGAIWFVKKILPLIRFKQPEVNVIIVGNEPSKELIELSKRTSRIEVTGFVEDPYILINDSCIGIVPIRLGAGIKIKLLEFMACGIPVVSTSVGAEGIDFTESEGLFITDDEIEFAAFTLKLLENKELAVQYGDLARKSIDSSYNNEANAELILDTFEVMREKELVGVK